MWIKTQNGTLLNTDQLTAIQKATMYVPGSRCTKDDILHYAIAGTFAGETVGRAVIADELTFAEAKTLLGYLFDLVLDDPNLSSVPYLLDCIRQEVDPQTEDDAVILTEQGRALLREQPRELVETRQLDGDGEAR